MTSITHRSTNFLNFSSVELFNDDQFEKQNCLYSNFDFQDLQNRILNQEIDPSDKLNVDLNFQCDLLAAVQIVNREEVLLHLQDLQRMIYSYLQIAGLWNPSQRSGVLEKLELIEAHIAVLESDFTSNLQSRLSKIILLETHLDQSQGYKPNFFEEEPIDLGEIAVMTQNAPFMEFLLDQGYILKPNEWKRGDFFKPYLASKSTSASLALLQMLLDRGFKLSDLLSSHYDSWMSVKIGAKENRDVNLENLIDCESKRTNPYLMKV